MSINKLRLSLADIERELIEDIGYRTDAVSYGTSRGSTGKSYFNPEQKKNSWQMKPLDWSVFKRAKKFVSAFVNGEVIPIFYASDRVSEPVSRYNITVKGELKEGWEEIFGKAFGIDAQTFRDLYPKYDDYDNPVILDGIDGISFRMDSNKSMEMFISILDKGIDSQNGMDNFKRKWRRFFKPLKFNEKDIQFTTYNKESYNKESVSIDIPVVPLGGESPLKKNKKKKKTVKVAVMRRSF